MSGSTCLNPLCAPRITHRVTQCPRCGRQAFSKEEIARRGSHVFGLGAILAAIMGGVIFFLAPGILAALAGNRDAGFRGSPGQAQLALVGFGALLAFGCAMMLSGLRMIKGRSSRLSTCTAIALFAISVGAIVTLLYSRMAGDHGLICRISAKLLLNPKASRLRTPTPL